MMKLVVVVAEPTENVSQVLVMAYPVLLGMLVVFLVLAWS